MQDPRVTRCEAVTIPISRIGVLQIHPARRLVTKEVNGGILGVIVRLREVLRMSEGELHLSEMFLRSCLNANYKE